MTDSASSVGLHNIYYPTELVGLRKWLKDNKKLWDELCRNVGCKRNTIRLIAYKSHDPSELLLNSLKREIKNLIEEGS